MSTAKQNFEAYMHYLATNQYKVIALRDLAQYVSADVEPQDPLAVIRARQASMAR